jgi:hypothetical protein
VRDVGRCNVSDDDLRSAFSSTEGIGNGLTLLVQPLPAFPEHKAAAAAVRRRRAGMLRPVGPEPEVEQRRLSVYGALVGGDGDGAALNLALGGIR